MDPVPDSICKEREMANGDTIVQFRGLTSYCKPHDSTKVSFRYPVAIDSGFVITAKDWIGIFCENASSIEEALLSVSAGDPSTHQLCDGGHWKANSVNIECPEAREREQKYKFWYISAKNGEVLGRSDPFTICMTAEEYPCMSFEALDDQTLSEALCNRRASYENGGEEGSSNTSNLGSSFVLVLEGDSHEIPGSEYVMAELEPEVMSKNKEESNENLNMSRQPNSVERVKESSINLDETGSVSDYVVCPSLEPKKLQNESETPSPIDPSSSSPIPSKEHTRPEDSIAHVSVNTLSSELSSAFPQVLPLDQEIIDMTSSTVIVEKHVTQKEARTLKNLNKESRQKIRKLSEILIEKKKEVENLARVIEERNATIDKFDGILEGKDKEIEKLAKVIAESRKKRSLEASDIQQRMKMEKRAHEEIVLDLQHKLSGLREKEKEQQKRLQFLQRQLEKSEGGKGQVEAANKKLIAEKRTLEDKAKQLSLEKKTYFERSASLLSQLQESETKRAVEKCEKQVLERKIDYLSDELLKMRAQGKNRYDDFAGSEPKQNDKSDEVQNYEVKPISDCENRHYVKREVHNEPAKEHTSNDHRPTNLTLADQHMQRRKELPKQVETIKKPTCDSKQKQTVAINGRDRISQLELEDGIAKYGLGHGDSQGRMRGSQYGYVDEARLHEDGHTKPKQLQGSGKKSPASPFEERSQALVTRLREEASGSKMVAVECPMCGKQLLSRENDMAVLLHVEHCIQLSEQNQVT